MLPVAMARSSSDGNAIRYTYGRVNEVVFSHNEAKGPVLNTTRKFLQVCQVAEPGAKSAVSDYILFDTVDWAIVLVEKLHLLSPNVLFWWSRLNCSNAVYLQISHSHTHTLSFYSAGFLFWNYSILSQVPQNRRVLELYFCLPSKQCQIILETSNHRSQLGQITDWSSLTDSS